MKVFKLTNCKMQTIDKFQYEIGKVSKVDNWSGKVNCSGCLHSYISLEIALFNYSFDTLYNRIFEAETGNIFIDYKHYGIVGSEELTLIKEIFPHKLSGDVLIQICKDLKISNQKEIEAANLLIKSFMI